MSGPWIGLALSALILNAFAPAIGGHAYTAWSIRVRNETYSFLLRKEVNRQRAEDTDEIAEGVVRWLRPLMLFAANTMVIYPAWLTFSK